VLTFRNILFDLDGTLTDPAVGIFRSIEGALNELGLPVPGSNVLRRCIGPPLQRSFQTILGVPADKVGAAVTAYRHRYKEVGMLENTVYPGIPALLSTLAQGGCRLWVATSKPAAFAEPILEHFKLSKMFQRIYGSELDGTYSDKRDLLQHLLRTERLRPDSAVMIGDREHDVIGANANSLPAIGVTWGYGTFEELIDAGAVHVADTPEQLRNVIVAGQPTQKRKQPGPARTRI
jgi:phosphoglycolate phosphatase